MSLINDSLKRVRQASSSEAPGAVPQPSTPLQPVAHPSVPVAGWMIPVVVVFLIISGVFFVGFAVARHSFDRAAPIETSGAAVTSSQVQVKNAGPAPVATVAPPPGQPATKATTSEHSTTAAPTVPVEQQPKLQGIFYSPTAPAAIVNGKTVRPGDQFSQYHVVEITRLSVTLVRADGKKVKLSMDN